MRPRLAIAAVISALLCIAAPVAQASGHPVTTGKVPVLLLANVIHEPWRLPGDDGHDHLVYQVLLTNISGTPMQITAVSVRDSRGKQLQALDTAAAAPRLQALSSPTIVSRVEPEGNAVINMDVPILPSQKVSALTTAVGYDRTPDSTVAPAVANMQVNWRTTTPPTPVSTFQAPVIAAPVRGAGWLNLNNCCAPDGVHSASRTTSSSTLHVTETFAIDFQVVRNGTDHVGDGSVNEQYYAFGAPVLSSTAGTVVRASDGMESIPPHSAPAPFTRFEQAGGNYVVVKAAQGIYALYAHLQKGSVTVHVGDQVKVGQKLGLLGNSGNTGGPHLHFQLMNKADVFDADAIPYVFEEFTQTQTISFTADGAVYSPSNKHFTNVYPTTLGILTFP